jgi:hypothetical protein
MLMYASPWGPESTPLTFMGTKPEVPRAVSITSPVSTSVALMVWEVMLMMFPFIG